jgi:hypothetical protein
MYAKLTDDLMITIEISDNDVNEKPIACNQSFTRHLAEINPLLVIKEYCLEINKTLNEYSKEKTELIWN